jgi:hypothetical protein
VIVLKRKEEIVLAFDVGVVELIVVVELHHSFVGLCTMCLKISGICLALIVLPANTAIGHFHCPIRFIVIV